jgi:glycosyltransferase involved in cell wall biosynthesis
VKRRIWKAYRRDSNIVYPPVAVETFYHRPSSDYFLVVSELVAYKRVEDAVLSFSRTGRPLRVVGEGPEYRNLRKIARSNIEFCGRVSQAELREQYARCRAVVQPGEEDFGLVSVEALASGKPVIALGRGGVLESVSSETGGGFFYDQPGEACLRKAVDRFEGQHMNVSPLKLQTAAKRFSHERFDEEILAAIREMGLRMDVEDPGQTAGLARPALAYSHSAQ